MRYVTVVALAALVLHASDAPSAQTAIRARSSTELFHLAGIWAARPYRVPLSNDIDISVFGPYTWSVRRAELAVEPSGEGVLRVTRSVVDGSGRTVAGSVSIDDAALKVSWPDDMDMAPPAEWLNFAVTVQRAERHNPGIAPARWSLDGLVVKLGTLDPTGKTLELRFDPSDGRDGFGDTLFRQQVGHR